MAVTGQNDSFRGLTTRVIASDVHFDKGAGPDINTNGPLIVSHVNGTATSPTGPVEITTAQGAKVRMNQDGTFTYDATASALAFLSVGSTGNDTFTYRNQGSTDVVIVSITVEGTVGRAVITGTDGVDSREISDPAALVTMLGGNDDVIYDLDLNAFINAEIDGGAGTDRFVLLDKTILVFAPNTVTPILASESVATTPTAEATVGGDDPTLSAITPKPRPPIRFIDAALTEAYLSNFETFEVRYASPLNQSSKQILISDIQAEMFQTFIGPTGVTVTINIQMDDRLSLSLANKTVQPGSNFEFVISGDNDGETLTGSVLADGIDGNDGNDMLDGGLGGDTLSGGSGIDTADYSKSSEGVFVYLTGIDIDGNTVPNRGGSAAGDTLTGVENLIGSAFRDDLFGDGNANAIYGGTGRDYVFGLGGTDSLFGGDGLDFLSGVDSGAADFMDGGTGRDVAYYYTATQSQVVDMANHKAAGTNSGEHMADDWTNISGFWGAKNHANTLTGDANANDLLGGEQGDIIYGGAGTDQLLGRGGNDQIFGGADRDLIISGSGTDSLAGGGGIDTFYVQTGDGTNIITDYVEGEDLFYFFRTGATGIADLIFTDTGADVQVSSAQDTSFTVIVQNAELTDLDQVDANGQAITTFGFA